MLQDLQQNYDVIVIGAGHAGVEAASASARMGAKTLLITQSIETIGQMSCNPAIGGIGKGHLVKEIDAMGGLMAQAIDKAGIQFRILNSSKGPAVRATRAQADRFLYKKVIRELLEQQENLFLFQQSVADLIVENDQVRGIVTQMGLNFYADTVVLTVGTFLGGKIHIGESQFAGGRAGDAPSNLLAQRLRALPFRVDRLKTGTPPRIDGRSIDFSACQVQHGDTPVPVFAFNGSPAEHPEQVPCYITHTNARTHEIIRQALHRSPMYSGQIESVGPRYCPSIEDKIVRFAERDSHQIFVEPESLSCHEIYPNGISTSLPYDVQFEFVRSIKGFEQAHITRPGYAIEYDYFDPRDLKPSLETKIISNLFFAGQINGTTGYEEAAAQGLIAGLNAARLAANKAAWWPARDQAYIGVLIDDLINNGTTEPYRMFTSRAEHRLLLREDNADIRLTTIAADLGLLHQGRVDKFNSKKELIDATLKQLTEQWLQPKSEQAKSIAEKLSIPISKEVRLLDVLKRPEIKLAQLLALSEIDINCDDPQALEQVEIHAKYAGYIDRQQLEINRKARLANTIIPEDFDYEQVKGLSNEVREKLINHKPVTVGHAARISGVTPASISILLIALKKQFGKLAQDPGVKLESAS